MAKGVSTASNTMIGYGDMCDLNVVLDILSNKNESYIYKDLYKILYNTELYDFHLKTDLIF